MLMIDELWLMMCAQKEIMGSSKQVLSIWKEP